MMILWKTKWFLLIFFLLFLSLTVKGVQAEPGYPCSKNQTDKPAIPGYCQFGYWIPGIITEESWKIPPPIHFFDRALYQDSGVIEETARIKGYDGTEDYIALFPQTSSGYKVFIRKIGGTYRPARVVDTVSQFDYYYNVRYANSGLELSHKLAEEYDGLEPPFVEIEVCITDSDPELLCTDKPIRFRDWALSIFEWEGKYNG